MQNFAEKFAIFLRQKICKIFHKKLLQNKKLHCKFFDFKARTFFPPFAEEHLQEFSRSLNNAHIEIFLSDLVLYYLNTSFAAIVAIVSESKSADKTRIKSANS